MGERRLSQEKEKVLRAIYKKIRTTAGLKASLKLTHKKYQTIIGFLLKHKYIKREERGEYRLLALGEGYVTTYLEPALIVPFKDSKVQDFLTLFPEPYRGVMRLAVSSYIAKQSKIFDQEDFDGAFPGTILVGEAGIGKTPIGEAVCRLQGLKVKDHKINVEAINKGEFGGRWAQKKGAKWVYNLSYWFGLGYLQVEEPERIVDRNVLNLIRVILHGDKIYKKDIDYENRVVPFLTLNLPRGKKTQTVMQKVNSVKGLEVATIKRNVTLFCNPYRGYLGDPYEFFGKVMKDIPAIDLNFPVIKLDLAPKEKKLLIRLIHNAMKSEFEYPFCDKRGVEIQVLGYHALSGNKDITSVIYRVVNDRLQALESLDLVRPGWRDWYNKEWTEYVARVDPTKAEVIRQAIERQKELEDSIPVIDISKGIHNGKVGLAERHSDMLDELRDMRDFLDFPLTSVKEGDLPNYLIVELCKRYKRKHKGLRNKVVIEITTLKEVTEDNVRIGNLMVDDLSKKVRKVRSAFISDIQRFGGQYLKGLDDVKLKEEVVEEIQGLIRDLWKADLWATTTSVYDRSAIQKLREKSKGKRSHLQTVLRNKKDYSLARLQGELRDATLESGPWFEEFEEDSIDLGTEVIKGIYDGIVGIGNFFKGKKAETPRPEGGGFPIEQVGQPRVRRGKTLYEKWKERREKKKGKPEEPKSRGFMGRTEDDL